MSTTHGREAEAAASSPAGDLHRLTLRFLDPDLERRFQGEEGARAKEGFRTTALAAAVLWALAAVLVPATTSISAVAAWTSAGIMSLVSLACLAFGRWAHTLNRQHFAIAGLTAGNGLVILALAVAADALPGYAVGGIMLLYAFGFVTGTRFVFALMRTIIVALGFGVAASNYAGEASLALDVFFLMAASAGSVLGLRRLEMDRRRVYHQQLVISQQSADLQTEKEETERLLLNILPASVSARLRKGESPIADTYPSVSVLFADLVGFTPFAARHSAAEVTALLSKLFVCFDDLVAERGLEKIKTIGDAYMAAGGLPDPLETHAIQVVDLGLSMIEAIEDVTADYGLGLRVGVHSGPAAGGVIGSRRFAYDVWGNTVNVASRLQELGVPGRVHISEVTHEMIRTRFSDESRGLIEMPGIGQVSTYLVMADGSGSSVVQVAGTTEGEPIV